MTTLQNNTPDSGGRRAVVAFSGSAQLWWLRVLKPGFRHVLVVLEAGVGGRAGGRAVNEAGWLFFNPLAGGTEACILDPIPEREIIDWLQGEGFTVVAIDTGALNTARPSLIRALRPHTCVEAVARLIGINTAGVLTPWQLYKRLLKTPMPGQKEIGKKALTLPPN